MKARSGAEGSIESGVKTLAAYTVAAVAGLGALDVAANAGFGFVGQVFSLIGGAAVGKVGADVALGRA